MNETAARKLDGTQRRVHARFGVALPVWLRGEAGSVSGQSENLSYGGLCLRHDSVRAFSVGERVDVDIDVPGRGPTTLHAEVRWSSPGRAGLQFRGGPRGVVAAFLVTLMAAANVSAAQTSVPEFDPEADVELDMEAGGERPDEYTLLQAFEQQYGAFDRCVASAKKNRDQDLPGDVDVDVLLNPRGAKPLGVNARLPERVAENRRLRECLRSAVARAPYPAYDGVPVVVSFSFELDPGSDWVEDP
jgi:hypothetical protein